MLFKKYLIVIIVCRFCPYPQEIILELVERCRIRKLQLLAHQYLVPSKIEFHIGDRLTESSSHQQANILHRLGCGKI